MPSRYSSYDDYDGNNSYVSAQNSRRQSRTKVVEVPDDRISFIRQRELAAFYGEPEKSLVLRRDQSPENIDNTDVAPSRQLARTQRSIDDSGSYSRRGDNYYRRSSRSSRRDSGYVTDDRRGGGRRTRAQSEGGWNQQSQQDQQLQRSQTQGQNQGQSQNQSQGQSSNQNQSQYCQDEKGRRMKISCNKDLIEKGQLHSTIRERKDGNFIERNFDSSWDGVIAAGAGAAIGAITARRLGPIYTSEEDREANKKRDRTYMIGAAAVGAAALNAGENWFRVWAEQHEGAAEHVNTVGEICCEGFDNFPIA